MAALFADENVPRPVVDCLRSLGHDVITAADVGRANQGIADVEQLRFAAAVGRVILTNDAWDFNRLHATDSNHAGIVTFTDDSDEAGLAGRIDAVISRAARLAGRLIKVTRPN